MIKLKQKNWIKRIILMILLSLILVVNAPQIVGYTAEKGEVHTAYAAGDPVAPTPETEAQTQEAMSTLRGLLQLQGFFERLLWPILYMIGGLMDNSLLFGGGMGQRLRDLWVPIRNIVNIFFVIGLVGIALYNILGIGEDGGNFAIKTVLPKLVVGIIAVNFSFLGIKVALDAVDVVTTAIFALPNEIGDTGLVSPAQEESLCYNLAGVTKKEGDALTIAELNENRQTAAFKRIAQKYAIKIEAGEKSAEIAVKEPIPADAEKKKAFDADIAAYKANDICDGRKLANSGKAYFDKFKSSNVALSLALNMTNFQMIPQQEIASLRTVDDVSKLAINAIFGVVMYIIFAASFVALLLVLVARLVVMWLSIVVSPLLIVAMAIPSVKEQLGAINKISEHFVKHLIVPIPIALSLSIGWIMLKSIQGQKFQPLLAQGTDFSLGIPVLGMSTLQELVVSIGCVAVIWMGVFTSAEGTIAATATGWIGEKLKAAGTFLGKAPFKYGKWIPIGGKNYSLGSLSTFVDRVQDKINRPDESLVTSDFGKQFGLLGNEVTAENLKQSKTAKDYIAAIKDQGMMQKIRGGTLTPAEMRRTVGADNDFKTNPKFKRTYEALKKYEATMAKEGATEAEKKAAGEAVYKAVELEGAGITAATGAASTPAADAAAAKPGKKPAPGEPKPPTKPPIAPTGNYKEVPLAGAAAGTKYYTDPAGNVAEWDSTKGELKEPLKATDPLLANPANTGVIQAAQAQLEQEGAARVAAESGKAVALEQASQAAKAGGFTSGSITGEAAKGGKIFASSGGTITLVKSETEVFEVDPASGELKSLTPAEIAAKKAGRGTKVGSVADTVTIDAKSIPKVGGSGTANITTLKTALGL